MGNYQRNKTNIPEDIKDRKAYLVGGGIASLSAAFYLMRDGHMPGENITIFEKTNIEGGSMDGAGNAETGYVCRGGRELETHYECTWDLFSEIPSLEKKGFSILDEFKELNEEDPNSSNCRLIKNCGEKINIENMGLSHENAKELTKLFMAKEEQLSDVTVAEFFSHSFFETNFWKLWYSMFAFDPWHSVIEMKRYMERFVHLMPQFATMDCLVFTKYNQYESFILPLTLYLKEKGVNFEYGADVKDLDIEIVGKQKTVKGILLNKDGVSERIDILSKDLVMVTNGSMTECTGYGDLDHAPELIREPGSVWTLWENIAKNSEDFGHPEVFCGDIDKTKWESFTITCKKSKLTDKIKELSGRDPFAKHKTVTGGVITMTDSNWKMSVTCNRQPQFKDQPEDVVVLWAYGLLLDNEGNYIKKKMEDCTGRELLEEMLYHLGLKDDIEEILKTVKVIPAMMPYITSQFMPRKAKGDRPEVVPDGSVNLAFLGQFAEIPGDCVFTVEYSVRSAMMATYKLLNLNKEPPIIYPSKYDIRALVNAMKTMNSGRSLPFEGIIKKVLKDTNYENLI